MNAVQELATSFVQEHWNEIEKGPFEDHENKTIVLELIKLDESYAGWIVTEIMCWGTPTNYLKPFIVDFDIFIVKINDQYFKLAESMGNLLVETFPKEKTIIYFE